MREEKLSEDQSKKEELFTFFFLKIEEEKEGEKKEKSNVLPDTTRESVGTTLSGSRKFFQNSDVLKLPHTSPIA